MGEGMLLQLEQCSLIQQHAIRNGSVGLYIGHPAHTWDDGADSGVAQAKF